MTVTSFNIFSMNIHPKNGFVCRKYNDSSYGQRTDNKGCEFVCNLWFLLIVRVNVVSYRITL